MTDAVSPPRILSPDGGKTLGEIALRDLLPAPLRNDETFRAIAAATENEMRRFVGTFPELVIWARINELEEPLLTHLAVHMHADIWDEAWSLEAKRAFLFRQTLLHRKKGTAWAVEEAISLVYGIARVREWFEYGGEPGCFTVDVSVLGTGLRDEDIAKIEDMIAKYKRKSQHLCGLSFSVGSETTSRVGCACVIDEEIILNIYTPSDITGPVTPARVAVGLYIDEDITRTVQGVSA